VGGIANMVTHPVETVSGIYSMAEHMPLMGGLIPNPLKLAHATTDILFNGADPGKRLETVFNAQKSFEDDKAFGKNLVTGFIEPYKKSWSEGKYLEVAGRALFDVGAMFVGGGEANAVAKGSKIAAEAEKAAGIANVASKAGKVTEVVNVTSKAEKAIEIASTARKATEVAGKTEKATEVAQITGKAEKAASKTGKTAEATTAKSSAKAGKETAAAGKGKANGKGAKKTDRSRKKSKPEAEHPKLATGGEKGKAPTPDTIREGSVKMEQHPHYEAKIQQAKDAGFGIKIVDSKMKCNTLIKTA
jgi:hypothetical protein